MTEAAFGKIVLFTFLSAALVVVARNAFGKRHWIAWNATKFAIFFLGVLGVMILAKALGIRGWWVQYVAIGLASPLFFNWKWQRSRRIPTGVHRKVIANWETRTGRRYDPKVYEIDHKVPFARHGSHTMDNLRVIRRDANRRKGGRELKLIDWIRIWRGKDEEPG
jgi:hypothetical protein